MVIELVIYEKIVNVMLDMIYKIHDINFIQSLLIFFDGIPSLSKIIEQRRRRINTFIESSEKKKIFTRKNIGHRLCRRGQIACPTGWQGDFY